MNISGVIFFLYMHKNNKYQIINVLVITDSVFDYFYMFLNDSIGRLSSDFILQYLVLVYI